MNASFVLNRSPWLVAVVGLWSAVSFGVADAQAIRAVFEKPLIVGASVSADFKTESPGKRLSRRYTTDPKIRTVAEGGVPGVVLEPRITDDTVSDRTIVIGIDLLFWDSTRRSADPSLDALHRVMEKVARYHLPIVLGNVPSILGPLQFSRTALNDEIVKVCRAYDRCHLFDADGLFQRIQREGGLTIAGRKYTPRELQPDGLHLSPVAAEHLADLILQTLISEN